MLLHKGLAGHIHEVFVTGSSCRKACPQSQSNRVDTCISPRGRAGHEQVPVSFETVAEAGR